MSPNPFARIVAAFAALMLAGACVCNAAPTGVEVANETPEVIVPDKGAYLGAYVDFGETEDDVNLEAIEKFESLIGRHLAIVASSSYWGEQSFPTANIELIARHKAIPLVFWSPWDKPYDQRRGPDRFSLTNILAGKCDAYLAQWGAAARKYGKPFFVSFANEANGDWFPWSGIYYGGGKPIPNTKPQRFEGPEKFKAAYRYIVDHVRAQGATNILWVFHVNNYSGPQDAWNLCDQYYPGSEYVDWLGLSVYGKQTLDGDKWADFSDLLDWPYKEICKVDPAKPVMLAEFGVGEFPKYGNKAQWFREAFQVMKSDYPRLKAAVYWHERWQNEDETYSNLRVSSSREALAAFKSGVADPHWLDAPILRPRTKAAQH